MVQFNEPFSTAEVVGLTVLHARGHHTTEEQFSLSLVHPLHGLMYVVALFCHGQCREADCQHQKLAHIVLLKSIDAYHSTKKVCVKG